MRYGGRAPTRRRPDGQRPSAEDDPRPGGEVYACFEFADKFCVSRRPPAVEVKTRPRTSVAGYAGAGGGLLSKASPKQAARGDELAQRRVRDE
jgi:hypothetical protein